MKKPNLSIIIVSYNTKDLLRDCLYSLIRSNQLNHPLSSNYEVIVIDNASTDNSAGMIKKEFPQVKLIQNRANLGYAKANNQALRQAHGEYILFLNPDTIVSPKSLKPLIDYLKTHPQVGVITPRLELKNGQLDPDCHRGFPTPWAALCSFSGLEKLFPQSKLFSQYHQLYKNLKIPHEIDACCGAFLLTRGKIIKKIGGWDETYFFYGEDLDLCYRVKQAGYKIVYYPLVSSIHYKGASSGIRKETRKMTTADKETRLRAAQASIEAMEIFYKKFYLDKYPRIVTWLIILFIKLKGILRKLKYSLIY